MDGKRDNQRDRESKSDNKDYKCLRLRAMRSKTEERKEEGTTVRKGRDPENEFLRKSEDTSSRWERRREQ